MNRLRMLHNGDLRADSPHPSPHWVAYVAENGSVYGEVLTRSVRRMLDFRVVDPGNFFDIPPDLREHQLTTSPHHEEIILALVDSSERRLCTFLLSQVAVASPLRLAVTELVERIQEFVTQVAA